MTRAQPTHTSVHPRNVKKLKANGNIFEFPEYGTVKGPGC